MSVWKKVNNIDYIAILLNDDLEKELTLDSLKEEIIGNFIHLLSGKVYKWLLPTVQDLLIDKELKKFIPTEDRKLKSVRTQVILFSDLIGREWFDMTLLQGF